MLADDTWTGVDMSWYDPWLSRQLKDLPYCLKGLRVGSHTLPDKQCLKALFVAIEEFAKRIEGVSIDEITNHLQETGMFDKARDLLGPQKLLTFAALGWQSMLYQAAFNVCSVHELAIHQDSSRPHSGLVFDTYRVSAELSDRPLSVLLKAFGYLLPARSSQAARLASENSKTAMIWQPLYPTETNAHLLHVLLNVRIQWVDMLALHLDYDKSSRTLSVFGYPSFCLEVLHSRGIIFSFSSVEESSYDPRADQDDISQFLQEVLLSYRLLFGQSTPSRRLFRRLFATSKAQGYPVDRLLPRLCAHRRFVYPPASFPSDRPVYFAARDFPVLHDRVELIANELKYARPKSFRGLIRDKRDTLQYWTFWLVSIIGGISVLLSLIQVLLQAIQVMGS